MVRKKFQERPRQTRAFHIVGIFCLMQLGCMPPRTPEPTKSGGYTYVPVDPIAIEFNRCPGGRKELLEQLPDIAVRTSTQQFDTDGEVQYVTGKVSVKGGQYKITTDFINADTIAVPIHVAKSALSRSQRKPEKERKRSATATARDGERSRHVENETDGRMEVWRPSREANREYEYLLERQRRDTWQLAEVKRRLILLESSKPGPADQKGVVTEAQVPRPSPASVEPDVLSLRAEAEGLDSGLKNLEASIKGWEKNYAAPAGYTAISLPVYVGVGLRVTATVSSLVADLNISGLGAIGVASEANQVRGDLVLQTLGITGKSVATGLPIQNELNRTTVMNAVVAVSATKAILYDDETKKEPRVLGFYLPFPADNQLINSIISSLHQERPVWSRECDWGATYYPPVTYDEATEAAPGPDEVPAENTTPDE